MLMQNYPNPFNPSTTIGYTVSGAGSGVAGMASGNSRGGVVNSPSTSVNQRAGSTSVRLVVYDVLGREVAVLVNESKPPGMYTVTFDASRLGS